MSSRDQTHPPAVRVAAGSDRARVLSVITLAFATDPMVRWTLPDPTAYLAVMPDLADAFGGGGFAHEGVLLADDAAGAAMWLPPGVHPDQQRMGELMGPYLSEAVARDIGAVFEQMAAYHPDEPHWYLPLIGVDPERQGRGYGAALMRVATERCDRDGVPAYLESSNPRNISLYLRHGFEILGTIQVGGSPEMVPMLRRPRERALPR
jgi:ribosomal protein S18 acetylase RimI-like enzyme